MVARTATFRNRRYNSYVPACGYAADAIDMAAYEVDFLTPAAPVAAGVLSAQTIAAATDTVTLGVTLLSDTADAPFGRNVTVVASGAATSTVTIKGKDYMGQGVIETLTLNGATPVVGVKAFKWIDRVSWTATAATTINVGFGGRLGFPYRMAGVDTEIVNGATTTVGTVTAGSLTDPQTATTLDPRGLYTPTTTLNGTNRILCQIVLYNLLNANGNGGLYGIQHFGG